MNTVGILEGCIDAHGTLLPDITKEVAEATIDVALWGISTHGAYSSYKRVNNYSVDFNFSNLQELSKNC